MKLRIGVVQLSPKFGQVRENLERAEQLCQSITPGSLDLLCFPELAFTGYVFTDAAAISPYLEHPQTGPSAALCSTLAQRFQCHVIAGYPERLEGKELEEAVHADSLTRSNLELDMPTNRRIVGANSAHLYAPDGTSVGHYRKSNLYVTDKTWAVVGAGFKTFELPTSTPTKLSIGICMDLNMFPETKPPYPLHSDAFELASYCVAKDVKLLVLLDAWLDSSMTGDEMEDPEGADWNTLQFWASRLRPLWNKDPSNNESESEEDIQEDEQPVSGGAETIVVVCNRAGEENGKLFAGSSAIFSMKRHSGRPTLLDMCGRKEETLRIWHIEI